MNNENDLIDSLLKEHAKMKKNGEIDEQFLRELEEKIDAEEAKLADTTSGDNDAVVPMVAPTATSSRGTAGGRWALGLGVAACAAFGFMGYQMWSGKGNDIVLNSGAGSEQIANAKSAKEGVSYSPPAEAKERSEDQKARAERKLSKGAASNVKQHSADKVRMSEGDLARMPKPQLNVAEPSIEFEDGDDFGEGWGGNGHGRGSGGATGFNSKGPSKRNSLALSKKKKPYAPKVAESFHRHPKDLRRPPVPTPQPDDAERYGKLIENKFIAPVDKDSALSTFAVDVDTASYANLRRLIQSNRRVPVDSVRIEEMVNYFDYNYQQPKDEHPFAVHVDSAACPWNDKNRLVRVAIQGKDIIREQRPASNVVFLLDVSGSMYRANKLPLLKESMKYLLEELNEKDTVSIVVYAGASGLALPATHVTAEGRKAIMNSLDKLSAGGSTAGGQGIKLAYKIAKENFVKKGVNRIILATDGDFNVGVSNTKALSELVKEKAKSGVYLSVLGFGSGNINDDMLETITNNGNGNYSYIDSIKEGRKVLLEDMMGTMMTIAKDVKVQLMFNPEKVKEYRLIGYSNRVLPNSAFLDKTADAGEIGAGHTVTAFYEVVPGKASDKANLESLFKKKEMPKLEIAEQHKDKLVLARLAYKRPDQKINDESTYFFTALKDENQSFEQADEDFKFASSVALLGMVLRDSDYRGDGDLNLVEKLATQGKGNDGKGYRAEFLKLVQKLKQRD